MVYHILAIADLHWGAMEHSLQTSQYSFIIDTIKEMKDKLDLVLLLGDYWDTRVMLNSSVGINGILWMQKLISLCNASGVKEIRVIKGTKEHDNDQLEAFRSLEEVYPNFKIFNTNTYEETLPELRALYCPEENMNHDTYIKTYQDNIAHDCNIGFFHGGFDHIMPPIAIESSKGTDRLIYEQAFWEIEVQGPMFGGHWHNGETKKNVTYIGTPDKWDFSEYENQSLPGIGLIAFDTDDSSYYYQKIINPKYQIYNTFLIDTSVFTEIEDYQNLVRMIDTTRANYDMSGYRYHIRIKVNITNERTENEKFINYLRDSYISSRKVKIETKNRLQTLKKKQREERHTEIAERHSFLKENDISRAKKLQRYIILKYNEEIPLDMIEKILSEYAKE